MTGKEEGRERRQLMLREAEVMGKILSVQPEFPR